MDEKLMMAQEELTARLEAIAKNPHETTMSFAELANMPYDAEIAIPDVISKTCKVARVEKGEDYQYFTIGSETKTVYTVTNGSVTQANVTPDSENDLTFNTYNTPEEYVYLEKLLEAKYDPIALKTKTAMEACNRKEIKDVLDVMIASAVAESNTFANDSGVSALNIPKLEEMVRAIELYGKEFVLITGATVNSDIRLLNYNADKNQAVSLETVGIKKENWIQILGFTYAHSGTQNVLASDKAILVALSDSEDERPVHFVRRKVRDISGSETDKERIVVNLGPRMSVGAVPKMALSIIVAEQYGVVQPNPKGTAVYKRAESYS